MSLERFRGDWNHEFVCALPNETRPSLQNNRETGVDSGPLKETGVEPSRYGPRVLPVEDLKDRLGTVFSLI